jgi:hypothetical protein
MKLVTRQTTRKKVVKLTLAGVGAFLCLIPPANATQTPQNAFNLTQTDVSSGVKDKPLRLAAANNCLNDIAEGFSVETRNYFIGICYTQSGTFYVGHSKNGKNHILLPIFSQNGNIYVARNGRYTYTLDMNKKQLIIKLPNGKRSIEGVIKVIDS